MTNTIFYSLFFALFLNVSFGSLKYSQIHRTFMSMYKGMLEASTITVGSNGESIEPYFDIGQMRYYVEFYLKNNLSKYTKNYKVTYSFINKTNMFTCRSECRRVRIRLTANINSFYKYDKTQTFLIVDGDTLWT